MGTAVLYKENNRIVILRNIEKTLLEKIKSQCGLDSCICRIDEKVVNYGKVSHVIWMDRGHIGD